MYNNLLKLLQSMLFMLLLIISTPILLLFALIGHLVEKPKIDPENSENNH